MQDARNPKRQLVSTTKTEIESSDVAPKQEMLARQSPTRMTFEFGRIQFQEAC